MNNSNTVILAAKAIHGTLPPTKPLQPAPQFIKPNLSGNVNFDANQQAAQELQQLNGSGPGGTAQPGSAAQPQPAITGIGAVPPTASSIFLIIVIIAAILVLLCGWLWFFRRIRRRRQAMGNASGAVGDGIGGTGTIDQKP